MSYENRNSYLPCKYWIADNRLHRAFYENEEWIENPRDDWDMASVIVNFSNYGICGHKDEQVRNMDCEEWLIRETGINEDWYESHRKTYGLDGLLKKFIREKCAGFQWLSIYDHSGITISCGRAYGWDYSNVGFAYVPKNSSDYKWYLKNKNKKEADEWANTIIKSEIKILDDYCCGNVYCLVSEVYDTETQEWEQEDTLGCMYLTADTWQEEQDMAVEEIKGNMSGKNELIDEDVALNAIEENTVDVLMGQKVTEIEDNE